MDNTDKYNILTNIIFRYHELEGLSFKDIFNIVRKNQDITSVFIIESPDILEEIYNNKIKFLEIELQGNIL